MSCGSKPTERSLDPPLRSSSLGTPVDGAPSSCAATASARRRKVRVKSAWLAAMRARRSSMRAASPSRSVRRPNLRRRPARWAA